MKKVNKQVATLDQVLGMCNALGSNYNPSKASLQPTALKALLELARAKQEAVNVTHAAYRMAVNARNESFGRVPTLAARVTRLVNVVNPSFSDREEVRLIKSKFYPASSKKSTDASAAATGDGSVPKGKGGRPKRDKLYMLETFKQLVQVVSRIPGYDANELELKVTGLGSKQDELQARQDAVNATSCAWKEARMAQHDLIYGPGGVVETTKAAKEYIRAKFGFTSYRTKTVTQATNDV